MTTLSDHLGQQPSPQDALLSLVLMAEMSVAPSALHKFVEPLLAPEARFSLQSLHAMFDVLVEMRFAGQRVATYGPAFRYFVENIATADQLTVLIAAFQRVRIAAAKPAEDFEFQEVRAQAFNCPTAGAICMIGIDLLLREVSQKQPSAE